MPKPSAATPRAGGDASTPPPGTAGRRPSPAVRLARRLLLGLLLVGPFLFGAVHPCAFHLLPLVALVPFLLVVLSPSGRARLRAADRTIATVLGGLLVLGLVQCLPLPARLAA